MSEFHECIVDQFLLIDPSYIFPFPRDQTYFPDHSHRQIRNPKPNTQFPSCILYPGMQHNRDTKTRLTNQSRYTYMHVFPSSHS